MSYPNYSPDIAEMVAKFVAAGGTNDAPEIAEVLCMVEEAGEAAAAYRRWAGHARRPGTFQELAYEMADVIIATYVLAERLHMDLDGAVRGKFRQINERPFKEVAP